MFLPTCFWKNMYLWSIYPVLLFIKVKERFFRNLLYSYIFLNVYFVKISHTPSIWFKVKETILVWQWYPQKKNHFVPRSQNVHSGFHARGRADAFKESKPSVLPWLPEAPAVHTAARLVACIVQSWPLHMLEGLCEEMQCCLLSRIPPHTLVPRCWEDPARGLGAGASTQTHKLAGSHVFRLRTVHPMLSFTCIRESTRTPFVFIG